MIKVTSAEAQNRFGQLLDSAQREPVAVTRHGRPAAYIVSPQEMRDLLDARQKRSRAVADLEKWGSSVRRSRAAEALTDEEVVKLVHQNR